jgi:hypothetical protein
MSNWLFDGRVIFSYNARNIVDLDLQSFIDAATSKLNDGDAGTMYC